MSRPKKKLYGIKRELWHVMFHEMRCEIRTGRVVNHPENCTCVALTQYKMLLGFYYQKVKKLKARYEKEV